jgi:hypothetical protein
VESRVEASFFEKRSKTFAGFFSKHASSSHVFIRKIVANVPSILRY